VNFQSSPANTLNTNSRGVTSTDAIYIQDAWQINPKLKLVVGGREEKWEAFNGSNFANNRNVSYQDKTVYAFSPKASISYQFSDDWGIRTSYGRGVRFPTVNELFKTITVKQGLTGSGTDATPAQVAALPAPYNAGLNNPNLKPETADSWEIALERVLTNGLWRTSLFGEEKEDALVSQIDNTTLANITAGGTTGFSFSSVQNIDKVRTYGVETSLQANNLFVRGFDLSGSVTYVHTRIEKDTANPALEGTQLPLIPVVRAALLGVYHASDKLSYSLGWRFSGRQHSGLYNTTTNQYPDPNPGVYGGRSNFSVFDAKVLYKVADHWSASVGVDNITNEKYFTLYPYAQRTLFASARFDF
jgi:iron complex outermembrane receptor protein